MIPMPKKPLNPIEKKKEPGGDWGKDVDKWGVDALTAHHEKQIEKGREQLRAVKEAHEEFMEECQENAPTT
tara:strand:+ start:2867 stop:3079 length:213 start_codon:yes stop_codon:yes gene_type:complete